jgi:hypothetical protein
MATHPFHGGVKKASYTLRHRPLVWECMLGAVYAMKPGDAEAKYFDYNWDAARKHAGVDEATDLRVCRVKRSYQGWPQQGKLALFGIPKAS